LPLTRSFHQKRGTCDEQSKKTLLKITSAAALGAVLGPAQAESPEHWTATGNQAVTSAAKLKPNSHRAKNLILFVGDGMGSINRCGLLQ